MNIRLPEISIELPDWSPQDFKELNKAISQLKVIKKQAGSTSDKFRQICARISRMGLTGQSNMLRNEINTSVDVRAFSYLLANEVSFAEKVKLDDPLLAKINQIRSPMGRIALLQFIRAYFYQFDLTTQGDDLKRWGQFIKKELKKFVETNIKGDIAAYVQYREMLFQTAGPTAVIGFSKQNNIDFELALKRLSLHHYKDSRYIKLCFYQYYFEKLKKIRVGEDDDILKEICKPDIFNAPYTEEKLLGHKFVEILIDRTDHHPLSSAWKRTILTIAGDPRVPQSSSHYQKWWSNLGSVRIRKMLGWLSRYDLQLFLNLLENSGNKVHKNDMKRMFPPRKAFMEGLLNQNLVQESRLILSHAAETYLKSALPDEELPEYATVKGNYSGQATSMIYLRLTNDLHMIEGSHNFTLKIMKQMPNQCHVADYNKKEFTDGDLRTQVKRQYVHTFGSDDGIIEITHSANLTWQHHAIEFLQQNGIAVKASEVIPANQYRSYKLRFGA